MATTRRRSTGFDPVSEEAEPEFASLEELVEEIKEIKEVKETEEVKHSPVFVEEFIAPSEDVGPRFVEETVELLPEQKKTMKVEMTPKRHPRNTPRFSRAR
jgi:hypothetical protein